jgi:hypothetical protein
VSSSLVEDSHIHYAVVCLKTGLVLELFEGAATCAALEDLASAAPELLRAGAPADLGAFFARLGSERKGDAFQEIVFMSGVRAHVVQRLLQRPDLALLAVSTDAKMLGLMLSGVRERMLALERAR